MAAKLKRYSISVPIVMKAELDSLKSNRYEKMTVNGMLCDLILRGLDSVERQNESNKCEVGM